MFGPFSIIGYTLVDFPVLLGQELENFVYKAYRHWVGPLSMKGFVWLLSFCQWLAFSFTFVILFILLSGTYYGARAGIRQSCSRPAPKQTKPVQVLKQRMPEEIPMPDEFPMSNDLPPPEDALRIRVQTDDGLICALYYSLKAKGDRPVLHSYYCNKQLQNVTLIQDLSTMTMKRSKDGAGSELRLWLKVRLYQGPEIRVAVAATRREPGWIVTKDRVHWTSEWQ